MSDFTFDHIHIICMDLESMISFWVKAMGAEVVERRKFGTAEGAVLNLGGVKVNLRLPKDGESPRLRGENAITGLDHIGFRTTDMDQAVKQLLTFGCRIVSGPTGPDLRRTAFLRGPENILLEIMAIGGQGNGR